MLLAETLYVADLRHDSLLKPCIADERRMFTREVELCETNSTSRPGDGAVAGGDERRRPIGTRSCSPLVGSRASIGLSGGLDYGAWVPVGPI